MRELKFRAWDKKRKRMFAVTTLNASGAVSVFIDDDGLYLLPAEQIELMQYTGLKDKDDKEIFEGDIVDYNDDGECIGVVEYDAPEFYLDADATNWARMFLKGTPHQRVIGNIYENSELLKKEK